MGLMDELWSMFCTDGVSACKSWEVYVRESGSHGYREKELKLG